MIGLDGKPRCGWCASAPEFIDYHDQEWGFPVDNDIRLFEKICLESFQSGLSWRTILNKREGFREAFCGFDFRKVAEFGDQHIQELIENAAIIRHRGKIEAVINNAQKACEMVEQEGSLAGFFWRYEASPDEVSPPQSASTSVTSIKLSKELKKRGWKFVGPTTVYSFMQAMGLINDHAEGCFLRDGIDESRQKFIPPA